MKKTIIGDNYIQMLEMIIETSFDGIYVTDSEANTIMINKSYERITGLKRDELLGHNMADVVKKGIMSEVTSFSVLKDKQPKTIYQTFNTGKSALVTSTPFFDRSGNVKIIVTNVRDITELKELQDKENKRKDENKKYKGIIEELKLQIANDEYLIAEDESMLNLLLLAKRVAKVDTTVLINGETGSGKEVLAKYIYNNSSRREKPFIKINCGAIPENLIESEFFGYAEGSFTGASKGGKMGIFEAANNGTLLLDEIGELPLNMQVKLLRVLQDGQFERVGSNNTIKVDVRLIASTNRDLEEMVEKGLFREDLFYRLNVVPLKVVPMRERKSSIIPLAEYFLKVYNKKYRMEKTISNEALKYFYEYSWPGNVRELRNLIEMLVVTTKDMDITKSSLPSHIINNSDGHRTVESSSIPNLADALGKVEKDLIFKAYEKYGNVRGAAKELGIDPSTFVRKRKKYVKNV
ncbi:MULTISPECIES: sigma-54 interaction domain-containing protein [unclassified Sedimentibacter]|uniref:sigma-54 interaction domain-containing protein n=1 Tax=unclassified Sedimentibacter TaxID=2649220 RepID=UPI0027E0EC82|nr:sigma 54-interacting transcriptional regulator [Sedimentibacter sp. MB35-C1]WMJ78768.1 sigma 54-interacting transcriptional regulator [Sedimentibacter sp. MB35-C1]